MNHNALLDIEPRWIELTVQGRYCGRFDPVRGLLELQYRGLKELYDLAEIVKRENALDFMDKVVL